jgi:O-antigen/teichoic acid export membrane protein
MASPDVVPPPIASEPPSATAPPIDAPESVDARLADVRSGSQVVRGSVWFIVALGVGAIGSLAYWSVATRTDPIEVVSQGGFLFAALLFVNYATAMGLPVAVAHFGPANTRATNSLFDWGLVYTAATSLVGTIGFVVFAQLFLPDQIAGLWDWGGAAGITIFFLLAAGQAFAVLVEVRLVTMRLWGWVLARVVLVNGLRMVLFTIPALAHSPMGLLVILAATPALSGFVGAVVLHYAHPTDLRGRWRPLPAETRPVLRYASVNYLAMLASQAPQFVFPLIVGKYVGRDQYAAFWIAWTITTLVFLIPHTVGQIVLSEGSRRRNDPERQVRMGLAVAGGISVVLTVGAVVLSRVTVSVFFGDGYSMAADLLPRMLAAAVPWSLTSMLLARARVHSQALATVVITGGFAVATLVPASVFVATSGISGAATAWLVGNVVAAVIALVASSRRVSAIGVADPPMATG